MYSIYVCVCVCVWITNILINLFQLFYPLHVSNKYMFIIRMLFLYTQLIVFYQPLTRCDWNILYIKTLTTTTTRTKFINQRIKCYGSLGCKDLIVLQCYVRSLGTRPITLQLSGDENILCWVVFQWYKAPLPIFIEIDPQVQSRKVGSHRQPAIFRFREENMWTRQLQTIIHLLNGIDCLAYESTT